MCIIKTRCDERTSLPHTAGARRRRRANINSSGMIQSVAEVKTELSRPTDRRDPMHTPPRRPRGGIKDANALFLPPTPAAAAASRCYTIRRQV